MKNNKEIRVAFLGSAEFSIPILLQLIKNFNLVAIITEIDKPAGRGKEIIPPPPKLIAKQNNIKCWQPLKLSKNPKLWEELQAQNIDVGVSAAYGKIIPMPMLNIPKFGGINVHPSLLPKYRGPSPIQEALKNGDQETGVTIILMDEGMDSGDILAQEKITIEPDDNYTSLSKKLALLSAQMLVKVIPDYIDDKIKLIVQNDDKANYTCKITKKDGRINWQNSARQIHNQIRAYIEWPGSYTFVLKSKIEIKKSAPFDLEIAEKYKIGQVFKHLNKICVQTGKGQLELLEVKPESKKQMLVKDYANGHPNFIGTVFDS